MFNCSITPGGRRVRCRRKKSKKADGEGDREGKESEPYSDSIRLNYGKEGTPSVVSIGHNGLDDYIVFRSGARHDTTDTTDTTTLQHCRASLHSTGRSHLPSTEDRVLARCLPGNAIGHIVQ